MFQNNTYIEKIKLINTNNITSMDSVCVGAYNLKEFNIDEIPNCSSFYMSFKGCSSLETLEVKGVIKLGLTLLETFFGCSKLADIPNFDASAVKNMDYAFHGCPSLSDDSLNKIMGMCISATNYTSNKTLAKLGLTQEQATKCQSLLNYDAFIASGWTTGY